ncbi:hypothetical protein DH2020_005210 [Rehmannia glutinosa]|uniref:PUM-HD domain-containing protein n=1 Tax=Rehmannia glutinosa TaxID=99300 RepID=A0ABR0W7Q7_REHGL
MLSELGRRPMIGNNENSFGDEFEKEIGLLLREQRRQEADDREKELNLYRSGSAPPTVEGSLRNRSGNGFLSEEELRSDPAYLSYYYSNVNLNPRLPPPLLSREDWRFAQRLQGGSSAIGDRRKVNRNDSGNGERSMFAVPPFFNSTKQESENEDKLQGPVEWGGDGLIGLPGLGLGSKQKSLAEIFQTTQNMQNASAGAPASYSYAAVLGASLSRSSTPDPQRIARVPSPCPTPIDESPDLVAALSGMNLSNGIMDEENHLMSQFQPAELQKNGVPSSKAYLKGYSNAAVNGGGGLLPPYQHLDSPNSSFSNYGLSGYPMSPISGQLGSSNLPPLFENAAAASAMGVPGMDSRMHNLSRIGNQSALQAPFVDPLYLQYLRTSEYAAAQVAGLNDPSVDRNYMGNSYMDLLQKKSQYGVPLGGKSGTSSPHGYYANPTFGIGLSYPGSPLASPIIPNSAGGPGSPIRHGEFNMRYPGGMKNVVGSVIGPWHLDNMDNGFASSLLEEFKSNKTKCFELSEISGHVVEFSADQYGSRFIQQKLETSTTEEKNMVFKEIFPQALTLITDVFGNYVIQKFFEHGMASQRRELADKLFGHVLTLSLQMYGCRVIQKAIEVVDVDQKIKMVQELDGHIMRCVRDQNGNHVIQKCIECVPEEHIQFIVSTFFDQVVTLSTHPYGCRVIQRVLEHCEDEETQSKVMAEILGAVSMLAQDQYGNYVVQHVLEHGKPHERSAIIQELAGKIVQMSQQKFASNVVEKCLAFGDPSERQLLMNEMLGTTDENEPLQAMMKDQFANYVVQKVLETCSDQHRELILSRIKVHLNALKKYTYGKHIVARVEKLVAAGGMQILTF